MQVFKLLSILGVVSLLGSSFVEAQEASLPAADATMPYVNNEGAPPSEPLEDSAVSKTDEPIKSIDGKPIQSYTRPDGEPLLLSPEVLPDPREIEVLPEPRTVDEGPIKAYTEYDGIRLDSDDKIRP